jgi:UDP-glucose 4-epimerase
LIADASRIEKVMGWKAENSLVEIIESAWKALS